MFAYYNLNPPESLGNAKAVVSIAQQTAKIHGIFVNHDSPNDAMSLRNRYETAQHVVLDDSLPAIAVGVNLHGNFGVYVECGHAQGMHEVTV